MSRVMIAEYDAEHQALKLPEPLPDVKDHERVRVAIDSGSSAEAAQPWKSLKGCLPPETIDEMRRALAEASAPDSE